MVVGFRDGAVVSNLRPEYLTTLQDELEPTAGHAKKRRCDLADLNDIIGWHEEFRVQLATGSFGLLNPTQSIDYQTLTQVVPILLQNADLRASVISRKTVEARYPYGFDIDNPPDDIPEDLGLVYDFCKWLSWKKKTYFDIMTPTIVTDLAYAFICRSSDHFDLEVFPEIGNLYEELKIEFGKIGKNA